MTLSLVDILSILRKRDFSRQRICLEMQINLLLFYSRTKTHDTQTSDIIRVRTLCKAVLAKYSFSGEFSTKAFVVLLFIEATRRSATTSSRNMKLREFPLPRIRHVESFGSFVAVTGFDSAFCVHPFPFFCESTSFSKLLPCALLSDALRRSLSFPLHRAAEWNSPKGRFLQDCAGTIASFARAGVDESCERVVSPARIMPNHRFRLTHASLLFAAVMLLSTYLKNDIPRPPEAHTISARFLHRKNYESFSIPPIFGDSYECSTRKR